MQFVDLAVTSESLFSLINGDDMFDTFMEISHSSLGIRIFSKIYLYTFVSLFIFIVLSVFITLISNTYDMVNVSRKYLLHNCMWLYSYNIIYTVIIIISISSYIAISIAKLYY